MTVAPARERGLKYAVQIVVLCYIGRSREGAWIEIRLPNAAGPTAAGRSREGAWIEMPIQCRQK